jgi:hypothetical protein
MSATLTPVIIRPADSHVELRLGLDFSLLTYAYVRWRAEDLFSRIFHRCPEMTLEEFLDWNYQQTVEPVGCFVGEQLVGIGWIIQARKVGGVVVAEVGAAFFKGTPLSIWRRGLDLFLQHAFVDRGYPRVYGTSAADSRSARAITRSCGMMPVDELPWAEQPAANTVFHVLDWMTWANRRHHDG